MFIAKEKLQPALFKSLPFGQTVKVDKHPGIEFVVTRLGLITVNELQQVDTTGSAYSETKTFTQKDLDRLKKQMQETNSRFGKYANRKK